MKLKIIQISDLHFHENTKISSQKIIGIRSVIFDSLQDNDFTLLVFSGDIAYSGNKDQYDVFRDFISRLTKDYDRTKYDFVIVSGNHDLDFERLNTDEIRARNLALDNFISAKDKTKYGELIDPRLHEYFNALFNEFVNCEVLANGLYYRKIISMCDYEIEIDMINTSIFSRKSEESGKLYFPEELLEKHKTNNKNIKICVFHHPIGWLNRNTNFYFPELINGIYDIVFIGHEHTERQGIIKDIFNQTNYLLFGGGEFQNDKNTQSEFRCVTLDTDNSKVISESYFWNSQIYIEDKQKSNEYKIPMLFNKQSKGISQDFFDFLNHQDIEVVHKTVGHLNLSETFIHNDLIEDDIEENINIVQSVDIVTNKKSIINGKKYYGKTTLLKHYFKTLLNMKYVPVYISGTSFKRINSKSDLAKEIRAKYRDIYKSKDDYFDIPKDYRAVLIDDIEQINIYYKNKKDVFEFLNNEFEISILTKNSETELSENFRLDFESYLFGNWKQYTLIEVREYTLEKLLQNWYCRADCSEKERISTIEASKNLLKTINKEGLVNFIHKYIYISLQMIDGNLISKDMSKKTLPYYYEFLLNRKLERLSMEGDEVKLIENYITELSFIMFQNNKESIDLSNFTKTYSDYKKRYGITQFSASNLNDSTKLLEMLIEARILNIKNDKITFVERYLYFFTLTKYISRNYNSRKNSLSVKKIIKKSIKHFRKDRNSNLINFYIYHDDNLEEVIGLILDKARSIFRFSKKLNYEKQTFVLDFNESLIKPYEKEENTARERRLKQAKINDERLASLNYGIGAIEKTGEEVSGDVEEAYEMIELLSNILKVHWWKLDDQKYKLPILNQIIVLMEKCIYKTHMFLDKNQKNFINEFRPKLIEVMLETKKAQEREEDIVRFVDNKLDELYSLIHVFLSASTLITTFMNLSIKRLDTTIQSYLEQKLSNCDVYAIFFNTLTYGKINKSEIKTLFEKYNDNFMIRKVIELLYIVYLYQFEPSKDFKDTYSDLVAENIIGNPKKLIK